MRKSGIRERKLKRLAQFVIFKFKYIKFVLTLYKISSTKYNNHMKYNKKLVVQYNNGTWLCLCCDKIMKNSNSKLSHQKGMYCIINAKHYIKDKLKNI